MCFERLSSLVSFFRLLILYIFVHFLFHQSLENTHESLEAGKTWLNDPSSSKKNSSLVVLGFLFVFHLWGCKNLSSVVPQFSLVNVAHKLCVRGCSSQLGYFFFFPVLLLQYIDPPPFAILTWYFLSDTCPYIFCAKTYILWD